MCHHQLTQSNTNTNITTAITTTKHDSLKPLPQETKVWISKPTRQTQLHTPRPQALQFCLQRYNNGRTRPFRIQSNENGVYHKIRPHSNLPRTQAQQFQIQQRSIMFYTGSMTKNRKIKNIADGITQVLKLHLHRGFKITRVNSNRKFKTLCMEMTAIVINLNCES